MSSTLAFQSAVILLDDHVTLERQASYWIEEALRSLGCFTLVRDFSQHDYLKKLLENEDRSILESSYFATVQAVPQLILSSKLEWVFSFNHLWNYQKTLLRDCTHIKGIINLCTRSLPLEPQEAWNEGVHVYDIVFSQSITPRFTNTQSYSMHPTLLAVPISAQSCHEVVHHKFALIADAHDVPADQIKQLLRLHHQQQLDIFGQGWESLSIKAQPAPALHELNFFFSSYLAHLHLQTEFIDIPQHALHAAGCQRANLIVGSRPTGVPAFPICNFENLTSTLQSWFQAPPDTFALDQYKWAQAQNSWSQRLIEWSQL